MATGGTYDVNRPDKLTEHALWGCQEYLYWADARAADGRNPAGLNASAPQGTAIAMTRLADLASLIAAGTVTTGLGAGTYYALFQLANLKSPALDLNFTFSGGTVTINAYSTQKDQQTSRQTFTNSGTTLTSGSGSIGAITLTTPNGERMGVMQVVVGTGCTVTAITLAEVTSARG